MTPLPDIFLRPEVFGGFLFGALFLGLLIGVLGWRLFGNDR